jgi:HD-like signal output (HDOD) protein
MPRCQKFYSFAINLTIEIARRFDMPVDAAEVVNRIGDLPAFPAIAMKALQLSENPNSSARELQGVIAKDQALTARVLRIVNSAMFSFQREISTLSHAVSILGIKAVRSIIVAASMEDMFASGGQQSPGLAHQLLWQHAWGAALASRVLSNTIRYHNPEEAFTAGLLHDIGKMILLQNYSRPYVQIFNLVRREEKTFAQAEMELLGFTHAHVGSLAVAKWTFPKQIVEAILYHHDPPNASRYGKLAAVVSLANSIMVNLGIGLEKDPNLKLDETRSAQFLLLNGSLLQPLVEEIRLTVAKNQGSAGM